MVSSNFEMALDRPFRSRASWSTLSTPNKIDPSSSCTGESASKPARSWSSSDAETQRAGQTGENSGLWPSLAADAQCPLCLKRFKDKYKMKRHYVIHTGEKPYSCAVCGFKTNRSECLKSHIIARHPGPMAGENFMR